MVDRVFDWEQRLAAVLGQWLHQGFEWRHDRDCLGLVRAVCVAVIEIDPAAQYEDIRPYAYRGEDGAAGILQQLGVADVEALMDRHFDMVDKRYARDGDFAAHNQVDGIGVMVDGKATFLTPQGRPRQVFPDKVWKIESYTKWVE